jgi:predicted Fe-S protein YdhL (DUF1289 family)
MTMLGSAGGTEKSFASFTAPELPSTDHGSLSSDRTSCAADTRRIRAVSRWFKIVSAERDVILHENPHRLCRERMTGAEDEQEEQECRQLL